MFLFFQVVMSVFILEGMMIKWKDSRELAASASLEKNSCQEEKILASCTDQKKTHTTLIIKFLLHRYQNDSLTVWEYAENGWADRVLWRPNSFLTG